MIIVFSSDAYENITMFGHVAERFINMMGYERLNMGIIKAEDVSQALASLQLGIAAADPLEEVADGSDPDRDFSDEKVSLAHRALPLIEMLTASQKENCEVTWKSS